MLTGVTQLDNLVKCESMGNLCTTVGWMILRRNVCFNLGLGSQILEN